ncbi:MAG TPA: maleylpyruvate isomerase N-terminal domain-containing protein [Ktedonobacteraceae bacterium]
MNKATFIEALRSGRKQWDDLLAEIDESRMLEPMEEGGWSVKDTIVHNTWNEREMIGVCQQRALVGSDLWNVSQDERNARPVEEMRDVPLSEILAESRQVCAQFFEAAQTLSDEDLNDARCFREMPEAWVPWQVIAGGSFNHYPEHIAIMRRWLDRRA